MTCRDNQRTVQILGPIPEHLSKTLEKSNYVLKRDAPGHLLREPWLSAFDPLASSHTSLTAEALSLGTCRIDGDILVYGYKDAAKLLYLARTCLLKPGHSVYWICSHPIRKQWATDDRRRAEVLFSLLLADRASFPDKRDITHVKDLGVGFNTCQLKHKPSAKELNIFLTPQKPARRRKSQLRKTVDLISGCDLTVKETKAGQRIYDFRQQYATNRALGRCLDDGVKNLLIFGAGQHTRDMLDIFKVSPVNIVAIADDSYRTIKKSEYPWPVISPDKCSSSGADAILISSSTSEEKIVEKCSSLSLKGISLYTIYRDGPDEA